MNSPQRLDGKPRVLILSASSGAGHVRAAEALEQAFRIHGFARAGLDRKTERGV